MMKKLLFVCLCFLSTINARAQSFVFPMGDPVYHYFDLVIDVKAKKVNFLMASDFGKNHNDIIPKEAFFKNYIITELKNTFVKGYDTPFIVMTLKETKSGKRLTATLLSFKEEGVTHVMLGLCDKETPSRFKY